MSGSGYAELAGAAASTALRTFLQTALGMLVLAFVLAGAAFWIASGGSWIRDSLAILLALTDVAVIGTILSAKRAVLDALAGGSGAASSQEESPGGTFVGRAQPAEGTRTARLARMSETASSLRPAQAPRTLGKRAHLAERTLVDFLGCLPP